MGAIGDTTVDMWLQSGELIVPLQLYLQNMIEFAKLYMYFISDVQAMNFTTDWG